jgi:hypothetical protein
MIEAGLEFPYSARRLVIEAFLSLPDELRPTHESLDEDGVGREIKDRDRLLEATLKRETGFFLKGLHLTYDLSFAGTYPIRCNCFLDIDPVLVKKFMLHMASAQPIFGFACAPEERELRNRVTTKQGVNTIESWVGRDTQRYIPGFYWLTLLPVALAEKHGVPLSLIEGVALEHMEPEGGQHFFRFYDDPNDWRSTAAIAELCSSLPGVFDVEKVRPQLENTKNFLELNAILANWK